MTCDRGSQQTTTETLFDASRGERENAHEKETVWPREEKREAYLFRRTADWYLAHGE